MDFIQTFISGELIYALGWTVMHSLWQGFVIAIMMAFVLQVLRKKSASMRYEAATFSLFLVLVSAICTFIWYYDSAGRVLEAEILVVEQITVLDSFSSAVGLNGFAQSCIAYFNQHLPFIVLIWLLGVAFFVLRLLGGLAYVQRLKYHRNTLLSPYWQGKVKALAAKIPARKAVQIFESASVKVPMVIGYFKPFILLPIGAVNQLEEGEIEAIIAHELAHVFRNDFLMNILLSFIEVLFYYHPAVWWISGNIRLERENCCDDIAIKVCGNSLTYAKALVRLQELNAYAPSFAMPFSGQKNQLLNRIKRILNQPQSRSNIMEKLTATCFLLIAIIFMSVSPNTETSPSEDNKESGLVSSMPVVEGTEVHEIAETVIKQDTIPEKKKPEDGVLEITIEDGDVISAKVDGEAVPKEDLGAYNIVRKDKDVTVYYRDSFPASKTDFFRFKNRKSRKKSQTITKGTNEKGQTIIFIEEVNREPVEIVVEENTIIVEGNELEDGDQVVIIDEKHGFPGGVHLFDRDNKFALQMDSIIWNGDSLNARGWAKWNNELIREKDVLAIELSKEFDLFERAKVIEQENLIKIKEQQAVFKKYREEMELKEKKVMKELIEKLANDKKETEEKMHLFENISLAELSRGKNTFADGLAAQVKAELKKDGLIQDETNFSFSLTNKKLKVNGKKQSKAMLKKYLEIYEKVNGNKLNKKSECQINIRHSN